MTSKRKLETQELRETAKRVRGHIVRLATGGGCFLGASLSAADLVVYLYRSFLHFPSPESESRDFFFLSKGHDVPAVYATLVELGWLEAKRLKNHLKTNDSIYWHPNREIRGVEFHSGSLGHLLPVAVGVALDLKIKGASNRVVVLVGDGELNEGSNWEALLVAQAYHLNQLTVVVDRNQFQANVRTEDLLPLEPLDAKFAAFGAVVRQVDGHDFEELHAVFQELPFATEGPSVVIAHTLRGKGLPSIQERADRWFCDFSPEEIESLLQELDGKTPARISSEGRMVR